MQTGELLRPPIAGMIIPMTLSRFLRSMFLQAGPTVYRTKTMPRGLDLMTDLKRRWSTQPPNLLFDVGANLGQTTTCLRSHFPTASIHAFEPVATTFDLLRRIVASLQNVFLHNLALGANDGAAVMTNAAGSGSNRVMIPEAAIGVGVETVPLRRLDSLCSELRVAKITLLKTDCEGFDPEVSRGASELLARGAIDCVCCEVDFQRSGRHADFFEIHDCLARFRYDFYALYEYSGWQYDISREGFANVLFVRRTAQSPA